YTGEQNGGGITQDESLLSIPLTPEQVERIENLQTAGLISHRTLLLLLQAGKVLPRQFDVDAELKATEQTPRPKDEVLSP
ncbi:MAG: hypothetical protein ACYT04_92070, partial [Nostoc sp.]